MMLRNWKEYQVAFAKLGDCHGVIDDATFKQIEEFVCQMYTVRGERNVNAARLSILSKTFKVTNVNQNFMKSAINYDGSSIPPCASELRQQVPRFVEGIIIQPEKLTDDISDNIVSIEENESDCDSSEDLSDDER